ncbi:MAG: methylenetetrahydrofolate reductase [NAD(P)H] [Ethanoligenens sp.]
MKISTLLKRDRISVSCEIFPPKQTGKLQQAEEVVRKLAVAHPDFISVTYGAGGGTRANTVHLAGIVQKYGVPALAHLTCVASTKEAMAETLTELRENKIENVLALRGDVPQDGTPPVQQYRYASELVSEIRAQGDFCIGAACYPEGHIESANRREDILHLKEKVECGCDFLTTQMFFDNNIFYNFLFRILAQDIRVPVIAGIMPVTNAKQIARICQLSGASLPPRFLNMADRFTDDSASMRQAGIAYATEQIIDLISNGVRAIHIYTMNQPEVAAKIYENISEIIK